MKKIYSLALHCFPLKFYSQNEIWKICKIKIYRKFLFSFHGFNFFKIFGLLCIVNFVCAMNCQLWSFFKWFVPLEWSNKIYAIVFAGGDTNTIKMKKNISFPTKYCVILYIFFCILVRWVRCYLSLRHSI